MSTLSQAAFIAKIMSALVELGVELFRRHKGDVAAAKAELRRIPDHWAQTEKNRAEVDAELAALKAEGK